MQLEQDALVQSQTPPRVPPCGRDDVPIGSSNSTVAPSRSRLWLPSVLNPAVDADSTGQKPHSAPAPSSASGRSLRDTQPLPSIGAAFPPIAAIARLDSHRATEVDGERTLPAIRALFPAIFARAAPVPATLQGLAPPTVRDAARAPAITARAQPRILPPPADPFPTAPTSAVRARLRPLPAGLRARGRWARPPRAERRPDYTRAQMLQRSYDPHGLLAAHPARAAATAAFVDTEMLAAADTHAQPHRPQARVTSYEHDSGFAYNPHASAGMERDNAFVYNPHTIAHHTSRFAVAQRDNGFVYNPHAFPVTGFAGMCAAGYCSDEADAQRARARWTESGEEVYRAYPIAADTDAQRDRGDEYDARYASDEHAEYAQYTYEPTGDEMDGFAVWGDDSEYADMDDPHSDAAATYDECASEDSTSGAIDDYASCDYDGVDMAQFAMCGVWACPVEAGFTFGAEFGAGVGGTV
ncbi:hypothetical protein DFH09DRAFT_1281470 [Mycena vulgaris]|nr:hypothetical protein DFH09DRAFT_1281470 [Mycena vulgaris]